MLEILEVRRMLSVSLNEATKVLTVQGDDNAVSFFRDVISVDVVNGNVAVNDNGTPHNILKSKVAKIVIHGNAGGDSITLTPNVFIPSEIHSGDDWNGAFDDFVQGGSGKDVIFLGAIRAIGKGGGGDDRLVCFADTNAAYGENGNDLIEITNTYSGDNGWDGGNGADTLDYSDVDIAVILRNGTSGPRLGNNPDPSGDHDGVSGFENFTGTPFNDIITGNHQSNIIRAGPGHDRVFGGGNNDFLFGGFGNDQLFGEAGNDYLEGNFGNDFLSGGPGADSLNGNEGSDTLSAADGVSDFLAGGSGFDVSNNDAIDVLNSVEDPS